MFCNSYASRQIYKSLYTIEALHNYVFYSQKMEENQSIKLKRKNIFHLEFEKPRSENAGTIKFGNMLALHLHITQLNFVLCRFIKREKFVLSIALRFCITIPAT